MRRVAQRVARGGHHVATDVVRRRYAAGLRNFFDLYQPLATEWRMYDTTEPGPPRLLASGRGTKTTLVGGLEQWNSIVRQWSRT